MGLLCRLGLHKWYHIKVFRPEWRMCTRSDCRKLQIAGLWEFHDTNMKSNYEYKVYLSDCEYSQSDPCDFKEWLYQQYVQEELLERKGVSE